MSAQYGETQRRNAAPFAGWWSRVFATLIDSVPTAAGAAIVLVTMGSVTEKTYVVRNDEEPSQPATEVTLPEIDLSMAGYALVYGFALVWFVYNSVYRQGRTGQTIGKTMLGIALYRAGTIEPIGPGLSFARQFVHIVDGITCYLGYLWPLWDKQKRTFTDMVMSTRVYHASTLSRM